MAQTSIEWTNRSWNAIVYGCDMISKGCTNCYAMKMAARLEAMGQEAYKELTKKTSSGKIVWNGNIRIDYDDPKLLQPLERKKPTKYFVNSMTDLFHEDVPFEAVDRIMAIIALTPQHTYQLLTKRADRMRKYFSQPNLKKSIQEVLALLWAKNVCKKSDIFNIVLPLPNLWLGVSVESQEYADQRIPHLLNTPAAIHFLSVEPLLAPVDLSAINIDPYKHAFLYNKLNSLNGCRYSTVTSGSELPKNTQMGFEGYRDKIDWVIVGGESGSNARPMQAEWVRSLRDQCKEADVPFFFKQWGEYNEHGEKVGKDKSGRLLDGVEYNEFPNSKTL